MSRGSTFILYRKYNDFKLSDEEYNKVVDLYVDHENKEDSWKENKKPVDRTTVDLPVIMNLKPFTEHYIDPVTGYNTAKQADPKTDEIRFEQNSYFTRDDHCHCDRLLSWSFGSGFDCLTEHFGLQNYTYSRSCMILDKETASKIRDAADYLLNGKWTKNEPSNEFVRILADGYCCNSYFKYMNRNKRKNLDKLDFEQNGYKVHIECPKKPKSEDDEDYYDDEDEEILYWLSRVKSIMDAYLDPDDSESYHKTSNLVMTYEWWG